MIKKLTYIELEYSDKDLDYIDYLVNELESKSKEIVKFFEVDNVNTKIKLYSKLEDFRNEYKNMFKREPKEWVCGFAFDNKVLTLSLDELRKTYNHENNTKEDLLKLILHEFTHSVHYKRMDGKPVLWFTEGLATYLSNQYPNTNKIEVSLEEIVNGSCSYTNYRVLVKYIIENYDKEYINKLIDNREFLLEETEKIYKEALSK